MTAKIEVEKIGEGEFQVRVIEGTSLTSHRVTVKTEDYERIAEGKGKRKVEASEIVSCAFEFLLAREPKESILQQFDLSMIGRYFAEFEREMKRRLSRT
jgi:hypothetical protein